MLRRALVGLLLAAFLSVGLVSAQPTLPISIATPWPARRLVAGTWEWPAGLTATANTTVVSGQVFAIPIDLPEPVTIDQLAWRITTGPGAAAKLRLGLYAGDAAGAPGALIVDGGEIAIASGFTGVATADISVARTSAGRIWFVGISDTTLTGVTLATTNWFDLPSLGPPGDTTATPWGFRLTQSYGALPASLAGATRVPSSVATNRPFVGGVRIGSVP